MEVTDISYFSSPSKLLAAVLIYAGDFTVMSVIWHMEQMEIAMRVKKVLGNDTERYMVTICSFSPI